MEMCRIENLNFDFFARMKSCVNLKMLLKRFLVSFLTGDILIHENFLGCAEIA